MNRPRRAGATLAEVAEAAGVSVSTASKVLNGRPGIAEATRAAVEDAMVRTGYTPSVASARSLRHDDVRPVAVVFDTLTNIYSQHVLEGILDAARGEDVPVQVSMLGDSSSPPDYSDRSWLDAILRVRPRALVVITTQLDELVIGQVAAAKLPLVAIDPQIATDERVVSIGSTNWIGGIQATEHLLALGHRRIGFAGPDVSRHDLQERIGGWRQALANAGIADDPSLLQLSDFDFGGGVKAVDRLLGLPDPPTAVVAFNDVIAIGVISGARTHGLRVPEDFSVIGHDDTYAALWPEPALTSIRTPLHEMGVVALQTAVTMARGGSPVSRHIQLATSVVTRHSTATPPRSLAEQPAR